jgi:hypothetical protein
VCLITGDIAFPLYACRNHARDQWSMKSSEQTGSATAVNHPADHARILTGIKLLHSAVWLFMASCILLIPWAALQGRFQMSAMLTGVIMIECAVLSVNRGKCPLTSIAALYTDDRADNFDIYLPLWLARHNKTIFGTLFVCGCAFALVRWLVAK